MITVHHLNNSRSQRILWLFEELELPYEIAHYQRDAKTRLAPPELKAIHPLGKAPVIVDDGRAIAESGAIIEYIVRKYGRGKLMPDPESPAFIEHLQWLHFVEGSAIIPLLLALYVGRLGEAGAPLAPRITSEIANHLSYIDGALAGKDYLLGKTLDAADIQMSFVVEWADASKRLTPYFNIKAYLERIRARPAYQRAIARGGPFTLGR